MKNTGEVFCMSEVKVVRKLYRSRTNSMIGGVCGGIAEHLEVDPTIVRLAFVLLGLYSGVGVAAYLILWIIVPYPEGEGSSTSEIIREGAEEIRDRAQEVASSISSSNRQSQGPAAGVVVGISLVGLGIVFLARTLNIHWLRWLDVRTLLPIVLIIVGVLLLRGQHTNERGE